MQVQISARHGQLSDATQQRIVERAEKLTRFFERLTAIEVTVDLTHRDAPGVDLQVSAEHKHDFVASHQSDDLWASLDVVIRKVEQQLRKYKEKLHDRHRSGGRRQIEVPSEPGSLE